MVFQDYELIPTKRVNAQRATKSIFLNRLFNAAGAWNSVFLGSFLSYSWLTYLNHFNGLKYGMGMKALLSVPLMTVGLVGGASLFGEQREFWHLIRHYPTYRKEFKSYYSDLYYN